MKLNTMLCNKCGKEFDYWDKQEGYGIHCLAGYGTKYDGMQIDLDLCCDCMEALLDSCRLEAASERKYAKRPTGSSSGYTCMREEDDGK